MAAALGMAFLLGCKKEPIRHPEGSAEDIFPFLDSERSFKKGAPQGIAKGIGHGVSVTLIFTGKGHRHGLSMGHILREDDLDRLHLTLDQAHARARSNLDEYARTLKIETKIMAGPDKGKYALVRGYWPVLTTFLLPEYRNKAALAIGARDMFILLPRHDEIYIFSKDEKSLKLASKVREAAQSRVNPLELSMDPLTFGLFTTNNNELQPFTE